MARSNSRKLDDSQPRIVPPALTLVRANSDEPNEPTPIMEDGALKIEHEDGSVTIDFNPPADDDEGSSSDFDSNLAKNMSESDLSEIATDLLDGIQRDEESRKEWLETRAMGINLLGLRLEKPKSSVGDGSAPLEGMSTVRHPLLLEATVGFQATARAELLPASGPVKVRNDSPTPPRDVLADTSARQELSDSLQGKDELAQALEKDLNHYLTVTATEYIPDTDRMLFYVGFGGDGFKKVYNCPLRRRPVSESIDAEDLIISNTATDLRNSGRVTHHIKMRRSTLKRMQILGVYLDVDLSPPPPPKKTAVDQAKQSISGQNTENQKPEDRDYDIYECYTELDIDEYAPKQFKGKGLPLPYRVTLEKESRKILDIRRNWEEEDEQCHAKRFFVQFPFIRGLGFYGLGYVHLLGNTTNTLTAAWRETVDGGMYANFPGFLYAKGAGRQLTNQFRVPPGGGVGIDVGAQGRIQDSIMALPYRDVSAGFNAFITHVEETGRRVASTASVNVGEGKQDAPVGTTLALIEQGAKVIDSAHKRLHAAQAEEFMLLKCRFKEDPEAFWRHNKKPTKDWKKDQFLAALESCELVPVADPNNPTSLHRIAKGAIIKQLQTANPALYDPVGVDMRIMRISDIDPSGLFRPTPAAPPPDPRMVAIQAKAAAQANNDKIQLLQTQIKAATQGAAIRDKAADRESRERVAQWQKEIAELKIKNEQIIHAHDEERNRISMLHELNIKAQTHAHDTHLDAVSKAQEMHHANLDKAQELHHSKAEAEHNTQVQGQQSAADQQFAKERHDADLKRADEKHQQDMEHARELHAHKLAAAKAMAKAKPKPKAKKAKE